MFTIEIEGLDELEREARAADDAIGDGIRDAVYRAVTEGAAEAATTHRYSDQTGRLTASITGRVESFSPPPSASCSGEIVAKTPYASFVEGGTAPHDIAPKKKPFLRFRVGGQWVSTKLVHHPGTQPHPFMAQAYNKATAVLLREVERSIAEAQKILER